MSTEVLAEPAAELLAVLARAIEAAERRAYAEGFDAGHRAGFEAGAASAPPKPGTMQPLVIGKAPGGLRRKRAVMLVPGGEMADWLTAGSDYTAARSMNVVAMASDPSGALGLLASGAADVLVAATPDALWPAIQIMTCAGPVTVPDDQLRPQRVYRMRPAESDQLRPERPAEEARVIPIRTHRPKRKLTGV